MNSPACIPAPLRYDPSFEVPEEDEAETVQGLVDTMRKISTVVHADEGHAYRSVHAKSHGLLLAEMEVLDGLPEPLAQGVFARPGRWPAAVRLSTVPGDLLADSVSTPRGMAIKIVGVKGDRLPGSEGHATQDFLMVNGPVFSAPTAKAFLRSAKLLAATTDKAEGLKKVLSATLRGVESLVEKVGGTGATLKALGGHPATNILGERFFTQVPFRYGPYMAKLSVVPVSAKLVALKNAPLDLDGHPDAIREAVVAHFASEGGVWEVRVQLCTDLESMPIEDSSVEWPEERSPYLTVARLTAQPQPAWTPARSQAVDDGMSFSPWHGLADHRPIGSIMRVRKAAYEMAEEFRSTRNATRVAEPATLASLPV